MLTMLWAIGAACTGATPASMMLAGAIVAKAILLVGEMS